MPRSLMKRRPGWRRLRRTHADRAANAFAVPAHPPSLPSFVQPHVHLSSRNAVRSAIRRRRRRVAAHHLDRPRRARKSDQRWLSPAPSIWSIRATTRSRAFAAVKSYDDLPEAPDVVAIAVPPAAVPEAVAAAARKGTAAGIIITAGLGHGPGSLAALCERNARAAGMRLVGPNCLGVLVPGASLNASFAAAAPPAGDLALISQSGAIAAGLVQWAAGRGVGFSAIVSIGDSLDVDFADLLDHFALDRGTRAILLYVELIRDARKFMSAARAAARTKPVLVIKSGRHAQGAKAAADPYRRARRLRRGL